MKQYVSLLGDNLVIVFNETDENGNLLIEKLYDILGDNNIITTNELRQTGSDSLLLDCDTMYTYDLTQKDISELKKYGVVTLYKGGFISEFIDENLESDKDFIKWLGFESLNEIIEQFGYTE